MTKVTLEVGDLFSILGAHGIECAETTIIQG